MILVTGANGFVGHKIMELLPNVVASPSLRNVTEEEVKRIVEEQDIDVIIHTAAISDIGACIAHPEDSYIANVQLPVYLAKAAKNRKLIVFSSDQVYSGSDEEGPYSEDMVKPDNIYAVHKLEMEQRVLDIAPDAVMLRAEWMYYYY
jgi:dTDP-4-dehydrorhamnose reductase